ncbi:MAG: Fe-S cluster assembly protein SufD [Bacteroidales bacterium]|nr:Fe-S cluster assembly protein SufD [Bacteroidales bacterium]
MQNTDKKYNRLEQSLIAFFEKKKADLSANCSPKIVLSRQQAFDEFQRTGLPTSTDENWKNTRIEKLYNESFQPDNPPTGYEKSASEIFQCEIHGFDAHVISMLNGWYYCPEGMQLQTLKDGLVVGSIIAAQKQYPELFDRYFDEIAQNRKHGLTAVSRALFRDGVFIYVPDGVEVKKALQLIKIVNRDEKMMVNSRNLIILGKNSKLSLLHCDDSINHNPGFINTFTEVQLGENASIELYKLQNINNETALLNSTFIRQERNSRSKVNVVTLNGGLIRNELNVDLLGEGADADLNGIYLMDNEQHIDNQVFVNHAVPNCTSSELFKGVLDEKATGVFNGNIFVARDAQNTNAFQRNNNILLSPTAKIDTRPFLEIYADDVKCSHGATVGQLDEEALFYLKQRGIPRQDAYLLLMYAFTAEVTGKIAINALRSNIEDMIKKRLRGELAICEKCVLHCNHPVIPLEFEIDMSRV